jgi:hypothetical protein
MANRGNGDGVSISIPNARTAPANGFGTKDEGRLIFRMAGNLKKIIPKGAKSPDQEEPER